MKYIPAIDLWDRGVDELISNGTIKLQVGQWVYCGNGPIKSRFLGYSNGIYDVAHGNSHTYVVRKFRQRIAAKKKAIQRALPIAA